MITTPNTKERCRIARKIKQTPRDKGCHIGES